MKEEINKELKNKKAKVDSIETRVEEGKEVKYVTIIGTAKKVRCPYCNKYTSSVHDVLKESKLKHLKAFERDYILLIRKRRFICHKCNKKFTEEINLNEKRSSISNALKIKIRKDLKNYNLSFKYIAESNNVSAYTVRKQLIEATSNYDRLRTLPEVISFDEFKADTSKGKYAFIINDPIRKKTLDILPTRKKYDLEQYFTLIENRNNVQYVISDMYEPYLILTNAMFHNAKFIVDRFHYIRYIMQALDKIRIRLQEEYGYNSKEYRLLKNKKNVSLLRKYANDVQWWVYTKRYKNGHIVEILPGDVLRELLAINEDLKNGYYLKEQFLYIINKSTYEIAEKDLLEWIDLCKESKIKEFIDASKTIENWLPYIVNSFIDKRYSNGFTEGRNNKIKVVKRVGYGYRNFDIFRRRLLYIFNNTLSGGTSNGRKNNKQVKNK